MTLVKAIWRPATAPEIKIDGIIQYHTPHSLAVQSDDPATNIDQKPRKNVVIACDSRGGARMHSACVLIDLGSRSEVEKPTSSGRVDSAARKFGAPDSRESRGRTRFPRKPWTLRAPGPPVALLSQAGVPT